jgi:hypothetical protein
MAMKPAQLLGVGRKCVSELSNPGVAALLIAGMTAFAVSAWTGLLISLPLTLLYPPLMVTVRFAWRCRTRAQVDPVR